jgi:hypothetical protein
MLEIDTKTEWTADQVIKVVTAVVKKRYDVDFDTYVDMIKHANENIDRCRDSDIIGLLKLIGVDADILAA